MGLESWQVGALLAAGLVAGVIGGMLGVGGSIIMIPVMVQVVRTGEQHLYQAAAMIVNVFVAGPAGLRHWLAGAVVRPVIRWLVPGAVAGVIAGVALSNVRLFQGVNCDRLAKVFGVFLAYVTVYNLYRLIRGAAMPEVSEESLRRLGAWRIFAVGAGMGVAAGLTGIGGGALAVPMQQIFLRMPLKRAIANSAFTIMFSALVGAIHKNFTLSGHGIAVSRSLVIAAALIPSAFVGGYFGAMLTHRLPRQPVRIMFILLLLWGVWRMWTAKAPAPAGRAATQKSGVAQDRSEEGPAIVITGGRGDQRTESSRAIRAHSPNVRGLLLTE